MTACAAACATACAHHAPVARRQGPLRTPERVDAFLANARVYERMGLITATGPLPLVGRITFLAAATPDSTNVLVALSVPRRATYNVVIDITRQGRVVRHLDTTATARTTARPAAPIDATDDHEPIVFQDAVALPSGDYQLALSIRDVPTARTASRAIVLTVPYLAPAPQGRLSSP